MASIDRTLAEIESKYGSKVSLAFADAIDGLRNDVILKRVTDAIARGDIEGALRALNIDDAVFSGVRQQLAAAFAESGTAVLAVVKLDPPGETRGVLRWNVGNPEAEKALSEWLGAKITQITEDTREAARTALSEGFAKGQGPRQIALDVVGRVGPNGRRVGGVLGLSAQQERWVSNMRQYLQDGDLERVLRMSKRDRRFDRSILKLIREGKQPTAKQIETWTGRYADRLLKLRGDTISRTETAAAVEQGRFDAFRQGMAAKGYPEQYAIKEWRHGGGGMKPRVQHVAEDATEVNGLNTPFQMPDGTLIQYPHAPEAPAKHVINCTCSLLIRMDWKGLRRDGFI